MFFVTQERPQTDTSNLQWNYKLYRATSCKAKQWIKSYFSKACYVFVCYVNCKVKTSETVLSSYLQLHKFFMRKIWEKMTLIQTVRLYPHAWLSLWTQKAYEQPAGSTSYPSRLKKDIQNNWLERSKQKHSAKDEDLSSRRFRNNIPPNQCSLVAYIQ